MEPKAQQALLNAALPPELGFEPTLHRHGDAPPGRSRLRVLQLNLGKLCNMQCSHCHVDAALIKATPRWLTRSSRPASYIDRVAEVLDSPVGPPNYTRW